MQDKNSCFAANDYRFNLKNGKSAIESCKTTIKTVRNVSTGVRATDDLPYLPKGFIILFSYLGTAKEFVRRGPQRFYQIKVVNTVYLMHTKLCNAFDLVNFINAALHVSGDIGKAYRKHLYGRSCQEICSIISRIATWHAR